MLTPVSLDLYSKPVCPVTIGPSRRVLYSPLPFPPGIYTKKEKSAYPSLARGQATEANHGVPPGHHYSKP